jgi:hypothetical protein
VCLARLAVREQHASVSDGRRAIFDEFCARYEPVVELPPAERLAVDTTLPLAANLESLRRSLDVWPPGLTG